MRVGLFFNISKYKNEIIGCIGWKFAYPNEGSLQRRPGTHIISQKYVLTVDFDIVYFRTMVDDYFDVYFTSVNRFINHTNAIVSYLPKSNNIYYD